MSNRPSRPGSLALSQVLSADPRLRDWLVRTQRHAAIEAALARRLPGSVARVTRVLDGEGSELVLGAANGAATLALRRSAPTLLASLRGDGHSFASLRVVVVPRLTPLPERRQPRRRIERGGVEALAALAGRLPAGPLREAVERLASKHQDQPLEQDEDQHEPEQD